MDRNFFSTTKTAIVNVITLRIMTKKMTKQKPTGTMKTKISKKKIFNTSKTSAFNPPVVNIEIIPRKYNLFHSIVVTV